MPPPGHVQRTLTEVIDPTTVPDLTWVESRRVFLDPRRCAEWDPFILWGDDWFRAPGGFPEHAHRGFETVTYVLEGAIRHADSKGNTGEIRAGDVQWMTAGRGIVHSEMPVGEGRVHAMQLWLNLPAARKMAAPRYQSLDRASQPSVRRHGVEITVFSGSCGSAVAPTVNHVATTMLDLRLEPGAETTLDVAGDRRVVLLVAEGSLLVGAEGAPVRAGQAAHSAPSHDRPEATALRVKATERTHAILLAAAPLGEPVVFGGPFVMNTQEQVAEARADLEAGRLAG